MRGHFVTAGTPEQIADLIEDWFVEGADGCNMMPPILPAQFDLFAGEVGPNSATARLVSDRVHRVDAA